MAQTAQQVMTARASMRVLKDLTCGTRTWPNLKSDLEGLIGGISVDVDGIYKRNRPWPADFGPKQYLEAFEMYAKEQHTSPRGVAIAVEKSLKQNGAYTNEVAGIVEELKNIRTDDQARDAAVARLAETIIETALDERELARAAAPQESPTPVAPEAPQGAFCLNTLADALRGEGGPASHPGRRAVPRPPHDGAELALRAFGPELGAPFGEDVLAGNADLDLLDDLVGRFAGDEGLACRKVALRCDDLARGANEAALFGLADRAFDLLARDLAGDPALRRVRSFFFTYADGDCGRALAALALTALLGCDGFDRVLSCNDVRHLFGRL